MTYSVALLSSPEHCSYIQPIADAMELPFSLHSEPYTTVSELPELFESIQQRYDAFCTTGAFSRLVLMRAFPDCAKPIVAISESVAEFYRLLLSMLYHDRQCDFSRVYFDFSLWLGKANTATALDYVDGTREFEERDRSEALQNITMEQLLAADRLIAERARQLSDDDRLDLLICRHSTGYIAAKKAGVPCVFAYPSQGNVQSSLAQVGLELDRIQLEDNMPAVICVPCPSMGAIGAEDVTSDSVDLQKALLDFSQERAAGIVIKRAAGAFELFTTRRRVQRLTDQGTQCQLATYLFGRLGKRVTIGYGIGSDLSQATAHAKEALELALRAGASRLIDESGELFELDHANGPSDAEAEIELYQEAAQHSGLSVTTIKRIHSALDLIGCQEITTQELADALQVTNANANRLIKQLHSAGIAVMVGERRARFRGRPTRVYRINL